MTIDPYEEWNLAELERVVADARATYIEKADKKQDSTAALWAEYTRLLNALRLRKRSLKDE